MDLAVEVLEQGVSDEKEQLKGVIAAEIKARLVGAIFKAEENECASNSTSLNRTSNIYSMQSKLQELEEMVKAIDVNLKSSVEDIQKKIEQMPMRQVS